MLAFPGGESILGWLDPRTLLWIQAAANLLVSLGIWHVVSRLGGRYTGVVAVLWWVMWPSAWVAMSTPYYYFWPIPCTVGLAYLWLWRGERTLWTLPLLVLWAQLRMTAIGTFLTMPRIAVGIAAWVLTAALVLGGHGRTQVWHDLYIGIGTRPNPYGIVHKDEHAIEFAAARGVGFKAPGYEDILYYEYTRILLSNPGLIARNTALNFVDAVRGWSFWGGKYHFWDWVPFVALLAAWRDRGVYRALVLVWLSQCATLAFVGRPQETYLWETMGLFVIVGSAGLGRAYEWSIDWLFPEER